MPVRAAVRAKVVTDATMTASPDSASAPLAGFSPNTSTPNAIPASEFATLSTGCDTSSGAWA
jgi:hypothetical protein